MVKDTFTLILPAYFHWLAVKLSVISLIRYIDVTWFLRWYIVEDWCASGNSNKNFKKRIEMLKIFPLWYAFSPKEYRFTLV